MPLDQHLLEETLHEARQRLLGSRNGRGYWEGELSSSALSTATAAFTLHLINTRVGHPAAERARREDLVRGGLEWLARNQNADGGWGDTVKSLSNISTTALCWAALSAAPTDRQFTPVREAVERWLARIAGNLEPANLASAIAARYGKDRTFSVPILTMLALAGRLGAGRNSWRHVPQLPFELAACPRQWFSRLRLPVVSYALPALIAIGQARHHNLPGRNPLARVIRGMVRQRTLNVLQSIQPSSGGFLEATPLTSFVTMSLIAAGQDSHPVVARGVDFLVQSARSDGSWPIDTNLATWVTTLSVNALAAGGTLPELLSGREREKILEWLLGQQYRTRHPYTDAAPGGWAWTDLPGGVPDADDTPGALLALRHLGSANEETLSAAASGVDWLRSLQNADGGIPTFCRGWGTLPFDRSSADLTAHTMRAWSVWREALPARVQAGLEAATRHAIAYLVRTQRADGAWAPLWFGNQHAADEENLTYGTSRVLCAASVAVGDKAVLKAWSLALARGVGWMISTQNADGGWGGGPRAPSSIEETALAVDALAEWLRGPPARENDNSVSEAVSRGASWLIEHTDRGRQFPPAPIGFYFAKLWYYEKLYPLIYSIAALHRVRAPGGGRPIDDCEHTDVRLS